MTPLSTTRRGSAAREAELWRQTVAAHHRLNLLDEAGKILSDGEPREILAKLARLAVPQIADWCVVDLVNGKGGLELAACVDADPRRQRLRRAVRLRFPYDPERHPAQNAMRTGKPWLVRRVDRRYVARFARSTRHARLLGRLIQGSHLCVPVSTGRRLIGVLSLGRMARTMTSADVQLCRQLAHRAADAIERERQRREQEEILETVPAMIWYKDARNRILRVNAMAARWCGLERSRIEGRTAEELFGERGRQYYRDDLRVLESGRPSLGLVEEIAGSGGDKRWVRRDLLPRFDAAGSPIGVTVFAVDVTEIKKAEQVLAEHERRQREFVANVSHELRTPVAAIKGFAETLRRGALEDVDNRASFVRAIESHADRLDWLVQDLLKISRLESGEVSLDKRRLRARRFLKSWLEGAAVSLGESGIKVELDVADGLELTADKPRLIQALDNLLSNAIRHSPRGAVIRIEGRREGRRFTRLTVRDQGPGIAKEHLGRLFDRFYRVEKGDGGGKTGLGLHIVKTIVDLHGGRVRVSSRPGRGAAFHISFPD